MTNIKHDDYVANRIKDDPAFERLYLKECFADEDPRVAMLALSHVAKARGLSERQLALKAGITPMALNRIFNSGNPTWKSLRKILAAMDIRVLAVFETRKSSNKKTKQA